MKKFLRYGILLLAPMTWLAILVIVPLRYDTNSRSQYELRQRNGSMIRKDGIKSRAKLSINALTEVKVSVDLPVSVSSLELDDVITEKPEQFTSKALLKSGKKQRLLDNMGPGTILKQVLVLCFEKLNIITLEYFV